MSIRKVCLTINKNIIEHFAKGSATACHQFISELKIIDFLILYEFKRINKHKGLVFIKIGEVNPDKYYSF